MENTSRVLKTRAGFPPTPSCPSTIRCKDCGLSSVPPRKPRKDRATLPRQLLLRGPKTLALSPPLPPTLPPIPAQTSGSGGSSFAVPDRRRNAAHEPLPRSPQRGLLPVCRPEEAERGKAHVAMGMRSARGRGGLMTMTTLRLSLASRLSA